MRARISGMVRHGRPSDRPADLPGQPLFDLDPLAVGGSVELAALAAEILQNGTGFEDRDRQPVGPSGSTMAGIRLLGGSWEIGMELLACADIHEMQGEGQGHLVEGDRILRPFGVGQK